MSSPLATPLHNIGQGFSVSAPLTFGAREFFAVSSVLPWRMFSSIPGLQLVHTDASRLYLSEDVTTENVPWHCQGSSRGKLPLFENHWHRATKSLLEANIPWWVSRWVVQSFFSEKYKPLPSSVLFFLLPENNLPYNTLSSFDFLSSLADLGLWNKVQNPAAWGTLVLIIKHFSGEGKGEKRIFFISFLLKCCVVNDVIFSFVSRFPSPWR